MRLISKEKLIKTILHDLSDFRRIVSVLYTEEFNLIVKCRIDKAYDLNYSMDYEIKLFLMDLIILYSYRDIFNINIKSIFKKELVKLIK